MARPLRIVFFGVFYHITAHGKRAKRYPAMFTVIGDRFGIGDSAVAQSYSRFLKEPKLIDCRACRKFKADVVAL